MPIRSGKLFALLGASRSGKTVKTKLELMQHDRILIWDPKNPPDYDVQYRALSRAKLMEHIKTHKGKPGIIGFSAREKIKLETSFDFFCRAAEPWVESHRLSGHNCAIVFEETASVTNPNKAPVNYGIILREFLAKGVDLYAITQRPAESDKTAVGNASMVHICRMQLARDRKSAADDTGVPLTEIEALRADQDAKKFDYITIDTGRGFYRPGQLTFPGGKAKFTDSKEEKPL